MQGLYQAYTYHISCAAILLAFLVSQERLDASDLDLLRIFSVLDTESPPTLGPGLGSAKVPQPVVDLIYMAAPA